jgi:putative ABC transport system substrate-binding protein
VKRRECWCDWCGGVAGCGASISERFRLLGEYTDKILQGDKPDDLPMIQPTTFELVLNFKTAHALGIDVPAMLHARTAEVIE